MDLSNKSIKSLCPLPWVHLSYHTDGLQRVCCHSESTSYGHSLEDVTPKILEHGSVFEALNSNFMKGIRKKMLDGLQPEQCEVCFSAEIKGLKSYREDFLNKFEGQMEKFVQRTSSSGGFDSHHVDWIDFSFGNTCNLACEMCSPDYSSQLKKGFKEILDEKSSERLDRIEAYTSAKKLKIYPLLKGISKLGFQGGEPLISRDHIPLLEFLVSNGLSKEIELEYNTNLTVLNDSLIDCWKNFKNVKLFISVDDVGESASKIRRGINWRTFDNNVRKVIQENISFKFVVTVQALNVLRLPQIFKFLKASYGMTAYPDFIFLREPEVLSINSIPSSKITELIEELSSSETFKEDKTAKRSLVSFLAGHKYCEASAFKYVVYQKSGKAFWESYKRP